MSYTPEQYLQKMRERIKNIKAASLMESVVAKVQTAMEKRIFEDGASGNGQKLGTYSTKPMYATKKQFAKTSAFKPQGKTGGKGTFKNKRTRQSMYLAQGYKQLKQVQGLQSNFVNLEYTGALRKAFKAKPQTNAQQVTLGIGGKQSDKKLAALKAKYGTDIFKPTTAERNVVAAELKKKILQTLTN